MEIERRLLDQIKPVIDGIWPAEASLQDFAVSLGAKELPLMCDLKAQKRWTPCPSKWWRANSGRR